VDALGELGIKTPEIMEKLTLMLKDSKEEVRGKAANSLRSLGKEAVPALIDGYNKRVKSDFVLLLLIIPFYFILFLMIDGIFGMNGVTIAIILTVGVIFYEILNYVIRGNFFRLFKAFNKNYKNKITIISAIGGIGEDAKEAIPFITAKLKNAKIYIRVEAARNLGAIGKDSEEALIALEEALNDNKTIVRREAALSLGKIGTISEKAIPSLLRALDDKKPDVRWRASEALGKIKINKPEVISALENLIHDKCDYVCESADVAIDNITENI